jgi:hypothetical protein
MFTKINNWICPISGLEIGPTFCPVKDHSSKADSFLLGGIRNQCNNIHSVILICDKLKNIQIPKAIKP